MVIVAFTSFCGYVFSKKYRKRKLFFNQLKIFNERFLSEISYYRRPLGEFISKYTYKGDFDDFLQSYFQTLRDNEENALLTLSFEEFSFLTNEEKAVVEDYFLMLGRGDSVSQKNYFSAVKEQITKLLTEAERSYKQYGSLYVKLGFLCGLLLLILIV